MTDPTAPFSEGPDPLAPPPVPLTPTHPKAPPEPAVPAAPNLERPGTSRPDGPPPRPGAGDDSRAPEPADPARPGTSRPGGTPARPGASVHEAMVVDLPPLPEKRSLFLRVVTFSWELTLGVSIVLVILLAGGVFYVVNLVESIGPSYKAAEFYDEERFEILVEDGDRVVYDTYLDKVGAWDHEDCAGVAADEAIRDGVTDAGCETGIEAVYDRADLEYTIYQRVLEFPDSKAAAAALDALGPAEELAGKLTFTEPYPDEARFGVVADAEDRFLILTVAALENDAKKNREECEEAIDTFHTSNLNLLIMDAL